MRGSRGVGTWGPEDSLHGKAQRCLFPQEYWFGTFVDWPQSLKQFFINVSDHILVVSEL